MSTNHYTNAPSHAFGHFEPELEADALRHHDSPRQAPARKTLTSRTEMLDTMAGQWAHTALSFSGMALFLGGLWALFAIVA